MPENRKDLVDEHKRRARRRLVGAAVLALAAAVIVPLFLESEPKPLGHDVQILIPAVEGSKFVSQISPASEPAGRAPGMAVAAGAAPGAKDAATGAAGSNRTDQSHESATGPAHADSGDGNRKIAGVSTPAAADPPAQASAAPAATHNAAPLDPAPSAAPAAVSKAGSATKPVSKAQGPQAAPVSAKSADSGFVVQLGAYADAKVAQELQAKLKAAGFSAFVERLDTSKEKLHRVRVGPYVSRDAADAARVQLKSKGHSGIVAPLS